MWQNLLYTMLGIWATGMTVAVWYVAKLLAGMGELVAIMIDEQDQKKGMNDG